MALRYLAMAGQRRHTAFLTIISTMGLAVGVATLLISLALLSGLQGQIKGRLIASTPQLLVEPVGTNAIEDAARIVEQLRGHPGVEVQALISGIAWASDRSGESGRPVRISSFDEASPPAADQSFGRTWEAEPDGERQSIYLSRTFANSIGMFLRDEIVIVAPRMRLTPFGTVPVYRTYRIDRVLPDGLPDEQTPDAHLPFAEASRLFATDGHPTSIEVRAPLDLAERLRPELEALGLPILVRDWTDLNKPLFLALRLEKIVMFATISLIIFVAALNLVSSVAMLIVEKKPQIGVLRTLGATERSVLQVYLAVGLLIGLAGTVLGNLFGLGISWAANRYGLIPLDQGLYALSHIPFRIEPAEVLLVNLIAVILSILATWYPARLASRLDPIVAISSQ